MIESRQINVLASYAVVVECIPTVEIREQRLCGRPNLFAQILSDDAGTIADAVRKSVRFRVQENSGRVYARGTDYDDFRSNLFLLSCLPVEVLYRVGAAVF